MDKFVDNISGANGVQRAEKIDSAALGPDQLKSIRLSLGLTQAQFAQKLGVSRVFVGLMERGKRCIGARTSIAALALRPEAIQRDLEEFDPLLREVEAALLSNGLDFVRQFRSGDATFDFFLPEFELAINLDRERMNAFRPTRDVRGVIAATGRNAGEILALLLNGRPVRAARPISSPIDASNY